MISRTKEVQDRAYDQAISAQRQQEIQANKKRRPVDFDKGDLVYLKKKGFSTTAPTTRLESQWLGPWTIKEVRGYSYVLDLPDNYKMSNLFHADRLRKADNNPLPQQQQTPPPPDEIDGSPEWEVTSVKQSRLFGRNKMLQYQVEWKGHDPDDEWYPARNLRNSPMLLQRFHADYPDSPGPPVRLQKWIEAAAEDKYDEDHEDDNVADKAGSKARRRRHA
jgi:hypothetical protein